MTYPRLILLVGGIDMEERISGAIEQHFSDLEDPRMDRTKLHKLIDILVIAICAVIAGADNWEDVEEFGRARLEWFKTFLELPNGIPSHDTFNRVFACLDPKQFQACFLRWIRAVSEILGGQVIAMDGKVVRRSQDKGIGKAAIDMVSAWATANHLVLGQVKWMRSQMKLRPFPNSCKPWKLRDALLPSMPWAARPRLRSRSLTEKRIMCWR